MVPGEHGTLEPAAEKEGTLLVLDRGLAVLREALQAGLRLRRLVAQLGPDLGDLGSPSTGGSARPSGGAAKTEGPSRPLRPAPGAQAPARTARAVKTAGSSQSAPAARTSVLRPYAGQRQPNVPAESSAYTNPSIVFLIVVLHARRYQIESCHWPRL